jgi:hypothetical protein
MSPIRRMLATLAGFVLSMTTLVALAPMASASPPLPDPPEGTAPIAPPDTVVTTVGSSGVPLWVVLAIAAGAAILGAAATLVTLAMWRGHEEGDRDHRAHAASV